MTPEWKAHSLSLRAFPEESPLQSPQAWWKDVFGVDPDNRTQKPGSLEDSGSEDGVHRSLVLDQFRISWTLTPEVTPEQLMDTSETSFPAIGNASKGLEELRTIASSWFRNAPKLIRIAIAGQFWFGTSSREHSYETLDEILESVRVDPGTTDFLFQINRKSPSKSVSGLEINRLGKWASAKLELETAQISGGESHTPRRRGWDMCALSFDVNNVPRKGETLSDETILALYDEMQGHVSHLAQNGDRK